MRLNRKRPPANVFADLGLPEADTHMVKAQLVARLQQVIRSRKLTQVRAAELMSVSQPDVSRMLKGQFQQVSVERLMTCLARLGCEVDIVVKPANKRSFAPIRVEAPCA